jgi:hypothetical protein
LPCKFTWRVGVGWVPAPGNRKACPEEEHCDPPQFDGTYDGQPEWCGCLAESPEPVRGTKGRKKGKG